MSRFVRPSKYRHVFGTPAKKEGCFDNVKVSNNAWDTNLVSANGKYIALNWNASGGGAFAVMPANRPGKLPDIYPLCRGHTAAVLDTAWSPFDEDIVVSGSDDGTFGVWRIDPAAFDIMDLSEKDREKAGGIVDLSPIARINTATRKVGQVVFHPTAKNVIAVSTGDYQVRLYDITPIVTGGSYDTNLQPSVVFKGPRDSVQSFDFDYSGNRLAVTSRDKQFRIYDARKGGEPIAVTQGHEGVKGARVIWCGDSDRIITTGFTRTSDRQMFLWNVANLSKPVKSLTLDTSSGVVMPFWSDNQVVFLAGKGDGNVRYYELEGDELFELAEYKSTEPQRGVTFAPRRTVNAAENEIGKAYKVTGNTIQPISFQVPRRAESFQSDIHPPAASAVAALSAAEFLSGKQALPNLVSLEDGASVQGGDAPRPVHVAAVPASKETSLPAAAAATAPVAAPTPAPVSASVPTAEAHKLAEPSYRPASPVKQPTRESRSNSFASAAAPVAASHPPPSSVVVAQGRSNGNGSVPAVQQDASSSLQSTAALRDEIELLKEEMAKRDTLIRKLEVENERLRANERKVREAVGASV